VRFHPDISRILLGRDRYCSKKYKNNYTTDEDNNTLHDLSPLWGLLFLFLEKIKKIE
jgi:hypothetical protein